MAVSLGAGGDSPTAVIVALVVVAAVAAVLVLIRGIRISAGVTLAVECVSLAIGVACSRGRGSVPDRPARCSPS